jgi:hypothetical protein
LFACLLWQLGLLQGPPGRQNEVLVLIWDLGSNDQLDQPIGQGSGLELRLQVSVMFTVKCAHDLS